MNKKIMQFRYYGTKNKNNFPANIKAGDFSTEDFFKNYYPIHYIRIQGPNSTKFWINFNSNSIMLGPSGVYELDLQNFSTIEDLKIEDLKFNSISNTISEPLIIDLIYG